MRRKHYCLTVNMSATTDEGNDKILLTTPDGNSVFECDFESLGLGRWVTDNVLGYRAEELRGLASDDDGDVLLLEPSVVQWLKSIAFGACESL